MKDIIEDLKILISNNYLFFTAVMLISLSTHFVWWIAATWLLVLPLVYYIFIHNIGKIAFNKEIGLPNFRSDGFKLTLKHTLTVMVIYVIAIILFITISYLFYDPNSVKEVTTEESSLSLNLVSNMFSLIVSILLMVFSWGMFSVIYSCCIFPDTNVEYVESVTHAHSIHYTFPTHWYYWMLGLGVVYYVNIFVALTLLCYVSMAYTLRYILNTPPSKKEKVKQHKLCESM